MKPCCDNYSTQFTEFPDMLAYHTKTCQDSIWEHTKVKDLSIAPLRKTSPLYTDVSNFDETVSQDAIQDTADNLGLAIKMGDRYFPLRDTAYKSLLDRAHINGTALPKLSREKLSDILNSCFMLHRDQALILVRDEKVSAVHSGDAKDYSVLEIDQLLTALKSNMDTRFPGNVFAGGYTDHSLTSATWELPRQKRDLLNTYEQHLIADGKGLLADKLMPGIRFTTSDTGNASAKVSAMLMGPRFPIHIGGIVAVDHRNAKKIVDFSESLDMLFAQFGDSVAKLNQLFDIQLDYPVNTMEGVCKALKLPKKASMEAISMFEASIGSDTATAHDVFLALQEIPFNMKIAGASDRKLLELQESMARALTLRWTDYDVARKAAS